MVKERKSFTLVEIIAVIAILGVLASLAVVQYHKAILRAREKDALNQLLTIYAANTRYKSQTGKHWHSSPTSNYKVVTHSQLFKDNLFNQKLGINIIPVDGMTYEYVWHDRPWVSYDDRWMASVAWKTSDDPDFFVVSIHNGSLAMAFNDSPYPAVCEKHGLLKPVCLVLNKIYGFLIPNAYAPCVSNPAASPNPCCCKGQCPTLAACSSCCTHDLGKL